MPDYTKQPFVRLYLIIFILLGLTAVKASAQKYIIDVITLQNGDIYKGLIVEQPDSGIIRLNTLCHNTLNFNLNEVVSVSTEKINLRRSGLDLPFHYEPKGYINITDFGVLAATGNNNNQNAIFSVSSFNGYSFASRFIAGAGIGIEWFESLMLPIYADTRVILVKSRITPFIGLKTGYSIALEDPAGYWGESYNSFGGLIFGTGAGVFIWVSDRSSFEINLSYRHQGIKTERTYEWSGETSILTTRYNRLELRFGILFQ
jgi:hypothetical protein